MKAATQFEAADFDGFWQAAARPIPVMIVGCGRWGRVWATVLAAARGNASSIIIVARHNYAESREWAHTAGLSKITVADSIDAALAVRPRPEMAIIASRPRDHARDAFEVLAAGVHILVEKPIASSASDAASIMERAADADRLFGVCTEFSFLPAFHQIASLMNGQGSADFSAVLEWTDPNNEVRHGLKKAVHDEINVLDDLLAHALSIFRILQPQARFTLSDRWLSPDGRRGGFELRDQQERTYSLSCDSESDCRRRLLQIEVNGVCGSVDFSSHPPKLVVAGETIGPLPGTLAMTSTLRLALGAFASELKGLISASPLTTGLDELIAIHAGLENPAE